MPHQRPHIQAGLRAGIVAVALTLIVATLLPDDFRLQFLAALLALTGGIYIGFGLSDRRAPWAVVEGGVGLAFMFSALFGLWLHPWILAAGWFLHIAWDFAHHPRAIGTRAPRWVPPACLVYDGIIGMAILYWYPL